MPSINPNTPITIGLLVSVAGAVLYVATAWGQVQANVTDLLSFKRSSEPVLMEVNSRLVRIETKLDTALEGKRR